MGVGNAEERTHARFELFDERDDAGRTVTRLENRTSRALPVEKFVANSSQNGFGHRARTRGKVIRSHGLVFSESVCEGPPMRRPPQVVGSEKKIVFRRPWRRPFRSLRPSRPLQDRRRNHRRRPRGSRRTLQALPPQARARPRLRAPRFADVRPRRRRRG